MSKLNLDALQKLCDKATPGPWKQATHLHHPCAIVAPERPDKSPLGANSDAMAIIDREADAELVVAARNALPGLLAEIRLLRARQDEMIEIVRSAARTARYRCSDYGSPDSVGVWEPAEKLENVVMTLEHMQREWDRGEDDD